VEAGSIEIQLVAGEFTSGGGNGVFLDKGQPVSLVNASEQVTYTVRYIRPITDTSGFSAGTATSPTSSSAAQTVTGGF
jgi:hypothetical protein